MMLEQEIFDLEMKVNEITFMRREDLNRQNSLEKEIKFLDSEISILEKTSSLFKHLLDVLLDKKKQEIQHLITYGLKTVFTDLDLKFHIDIEPKSNTIYTTFRTEQVNVADGDVLECFGGGVANIESFLLRIITLFQTKLAPYLFLDEVFSYLSDEYAENCSLLLSNLCEKLGLTMFIITHKELMLSHANQIYHAYSKNNELNVK